MKMSIVKGKISHPFVCVDSATNKYFEIDREGNVLLEKQLSGSCFDIWILPDGNLLCPFYNGVTSGFRIFDRQGQDVRIYTLPEGSLEIFACQPLRNGHVVLGDLRQRSLLEIDENDEIVCRTPIFYDQENQHEVMRAPRLSLDGDSYFVVQPGLKKIIRYSRSGEILWQADTHPDTFDVIEEPDGKLLYSSIEGIFELDREGREVWSVTPGDIPEIGLCWALALQLLPNGNIAVCNWLGHGKERQGIPLFEINREKQVVWSCALQEQILNISSFHLLDSVGEPYRSQK